MDNVISKVSQLKMLKEEAERRRKEVEASQTQNFERRWIQMQDQMLLLQANQRHPSSSIWSLSLLIAATT